MGFTGRMPESESRLSWAAVTTFLETDGLFVLPSGVLFYTIPKRALSTDDIASLRELLAEKLPPGASDLDECRAGLLVATSR
jgi:hypothetical protein